jgi:hypothetical protein
VGNVAEWHGHIVADRLGRARRGHGLERKLLFRFCDGSDLPEGKWELGVCESARALGKWNQGGR